MTTNFNISPALMNYLKSWHQTSTAKQTKNGATVNLPFQDFLDLFDPKQITTLQNAMDAQRIRYFMNEKNDFAFVLTWVSYAARSSNVFDKTTATICSRLKSRQLATPQKGDTLRDDHKDAISKTLTGKAKTIEHAGNISVGKKGVPISGWTEERKEARKKQLADKKAAQLAASNAAQDAAWARMDAKAGDK